jgi:aryl-alcohol dehydrogenase-like predicted oxidoreductase
MEKEKRHPDTSYEYIMRECEASLKRLQTDCIDLYQIHAWDPLTRPEEVAAALLQLRKQGKVRWFGVSNLNSDQIRMYLNYMDVECLQPPYSLVARDIEARELPVCVEKRIGVIAYSPLYRGLLTGKYSKDRTFTDARGSLPLFNGAAFHRMLDAVADLKPYAEKYGLTLPQLAISWVLTHPALTSAIVGIKTAEHVETIAPAADVMLENADWHWMGGSIASAQKEAMSLARQA